MHINLAYHEDAGIDWTWDNTTNRNPETGIRYGIIATRAIGPFWWEASEPVHKPFCPACGEELPEDTDSEEIEACPACEHEFEDRERDEIYQQVGITYEQGGYQACESMEFGVWVFESPFFTRVHFCSPCAPGAGDLDHPLPEKGVAAYCPGHDWFESGRAPYPVYSVKTGELVEP